MGKPVLKITDIEGDSLHAVNMQSFTPTVAAVNNNLRIIDLPQGWDIFHINAPKDSLIGHNLTTGVDITLADDEMDTFLLNTVHCQNTPGGPYVKVTSYTEIDEAIEIVKDNNGQAYLPEYNFNGIGSLTDFQAYQIKTNKPLRIAYKGNNHIIQSGEYQNFIGGTIDLALGWNMIGFPLFSGIPKPVDQILAPIVDKVIIIKDSFGMAYVPQFNFNGIGVVHEHKGYQIKTTEACSFTVQFQLYAGLLNFNNITEQNQVDEILEEEDDTTPPPVITDTTATVTILYEAIKQLTQFDIFGANHVEPTKCSAVVLAIKESMLLKHGFLNSPLNVFELDDFMELLLQGKLLEFLQQDLKQKKGQAIQADIKEIEEIEDIESNIHQILKRDDLTFNQKEILEFALRIREDDKVQQFSPEFKESFIKDLEEVIIQLKDDKPQGSISDMYPFYTAQDIKKIVSLFKIHIISNQELFVNFLFGLGQSNLKVFFEFFTYGSTPARYGLSSPLTFIKNENINTKIYGDDPLTQAVDGFTTNQQFSVGVQIIDQSNFYSQKILYNVTPVFDPVNTNTFQSLANRVITQITNIE